MAYISYVPQICYKSQKPWEAVFYFRTNF